VRLLTKLRIGRGGDCEIRLAHDTVSRVHARIELLEAGRLRLVDQASSNGTWLRDGNRWQRVDQAEVTPQQEIRFGEVETVLRDLLADYPAFALAGEVDASLDSGVLELADTPAGERFERPRRNPRTGDIEEQS